MTEPVPIPPTDFAAHVLATPMWCCRCSIHWATTAQPLCPSCLDDRAKELRGAS